MKAISIRQPWTWAIAHAGKDIENRTWSTDYRGPIAIHAAKGCTYREYADFYNGAHDCVSKLSRAMIEGPRRHSADLVPEMKEMPRGGFVATAGLVDVVTESDSLWFYGPYGFVLSNVKPLPFIPYRGSLGLFDVPDEILSAVA